jgi:hypothetical protein
MSSPSVNGTPEAFRYVFVTGGSSGRSGAAVQNSLNTPVLIPKSAGGSHILSRVTTTTPPSTPSATAKAPISATPPGTPSKASHSGSSTKVPTPKAPSTPESDLLLAESVSVQTPKGKAAKTDQIATSSGIKKTESSAEKEIKPLETGQKVRAFLQGVLIGIGIAAAALSLTTPVGWALIGLGLVSLALTAYQLHSHKAGVKGSLQILGYSVLGIGTGAAGVLALTALVPASAAVFGKGVTGASLAALATLKATLTSTVAISAYAILGMLGGWYVLRII